MKSLNTLTLALGLMIAGSFTFADDALAGEYAFYKEATNVSPNGVTRNDIYANEPMATIVKVWVVGGTVDGERTFSVRQNRFNPRGTSETVEVKNVTRASYEANKEGTATTLVLFIAEGTGFGNRYQGEITMGVSPEADGAGPWYFPGPQEGPRRDGQRLSDEETAKRLFEVPADENEAREAAERRAIVDAAVLAKLDAKGSENARALATALRGGDEGINAFFTNVPAGFQEGISAVMDGGMVDPSNTAMKRRLVEILAHNEAATSVSNDLVVSIGKTVQAAGVPLKAGGAGQVVNSITERMD